MPDELTMAQVAEQYGVSRRTIGRKILLGELTPTRKLPAKTGAYLFDAADVSRVFGNKAA